MFGGAASHLTDEARLDFVDHLQQLEGHKDDDRLNERANERAGSFQQFVSAPEAWSSWPRAAGQSARAHLAAGDIDLLGGGNVQLAQLRLQVGAVGLQVAKRLCGARRERASSNVGSGVSF